MTDAKINWVKSRSGRIAVIHNGAVLKDNYRDLHVAQKDAANVAIQQGGDVRVIQEDEYRFEFSDAPDNDVAPGDQPQVPDISISSENPQ